MTTKYVSRKLPVTIVAKESIADGTKVPEKVPETNCFFKGGGMVEKEIDTGIFCLLR